MLPGAMRWKFQLGRALYVSPAGEIFAELHLDDRGELWVLWPTHLCWPSLNRGMDYVEGLHRDILAMNEPEAAELRAPKP